MWMYISRALKQFSKLGIKSVSVVLQVFSKIQKEKKGKVKIFFCGSPELAKSIKVHAETFDFQFSKENF